MSNEHRVTEKFNCYKQLIKLRSAKISRDFLRVDNSARSPEIPPNHGNGSHYGRTLAHSYVFSKYVYLLILSGHLKTLSPSKILKIFCLLYAIAKATQTHIE
jgi:hypothetical protein